jgi:hypothetical protein
MSIISHHFAQQRKSGTQQRESLKPQQSQESTNVNSHSSAVVAPVSIASLARAAREGTIGWESETDEEVLLRKFDLDLAYGSNTGEKRTR